MKYLRLVSDIHLDFDIGRFGATRYFDPGQPRPTDAMDLLWYPEPMDGDDDTCLIIAGDLWHKRKFASRIHPETGKSWMEMLAPMFKYVVFVLGNHDYWHGNLMYEAKKTRDMIAKRGMTNVFLIEREALVLDQVKFVGGTLWTDFDRGNPLVMMQASGTMRDYAHVRNGPGYGPLRPNAVSGIHQQTRNHIFADGVKDSPDQRVICVSHMAPSYESIADDYQTASQDYINFFYYSDISREIAFNKHDIELWVHGHCHTPSDYTIGNTRIVCNPRGYQGYEQTGWDPKWRYDLS